MGFHRRHINIAVLKLLVVLSVSAPSCAQKKETGHTNPFLAIYAADPYRKNVPDSIKYLVPVLDSILESDQYYRWGSVNNPYGKEAQEKVNEDFRLHKKEVHEADSINAIKVSAILDRHGWLDKHTIGIGGNMALFLVIQHADSATQEKYLPMIKQAVLEKKEAPHQYALLADRLTLKKEHYQLYGTQLLQVYVEKRYYFYPIIEPEHLVERRAEIGMAQATLDQYLRSFNLNWSLDQYQQELPHVMQLLASAKKH